MQKLKSIIQNDPIELIIWDFDGVIFDLEWNFQSTPADFVTKVYEAINQIDDSIIKDKQEFLARLFPYPEMSQIGLKYGKDVQAEIMALYQDKESAALHLAVPNQQTINLISELDLPQVIWSSNLFSTINPLLKQAGIDHKMGCVVSLDKVIQSKPNVEGFQIIRQKYPNIDLENIIFVGDSLISDKIAAENSGVRFFHYQR